jgi:hypothetical protein
MGTYGCIVYTPCIIIIKKSFINFLLTVLYEQAFVELWIPQQNENAVLSTGLFVTDINVSNL